jgi:hypothetical protein
LRGDLSYSEFLALHLVNLPSSSIILQKELT